MYETYEKLLKERNIKSSDVAKGAGISEQLLSNWKRRGGGVSYPTACKIATYLQVNPMLFWEKGHHSEVDKYDSSLITYINTENKSNLEDKVKDAFSKAPYEIKKAVMKLLDIEEA